jgi:16S rRNA (cytosine967-C5)-methyltransferase
MISPARTVAFDILLRVERQQAYASELLHSGRLDALSPADRGLCTELVMGVLRWRSRLDAYIRSYVFSPFAKLDLEALTALRLGTYQIAFLERIPAHAAINESVELVKYAGKTSAASLTNAVLRKISTFTGKRVAQPASAGERPVRMPPRGGKTPELIARFYAHPEWLVERWAERFGLEAAERVCTYNQTVPQTAMRLRDAAVADELKSEGIELAPGVLLAGARRVVSGDVVHTRTYGEGRVSIQDEASQLVAVLVGHGARLLDCCAAPGGKAALLAQRNPGAEIVAAEIHPHRVRLLQRLLEREQARVQVVTADATALPIAGQFDRVLADVPCSGTGTLARNPEIKWRLRPTDLAGLHDKQVAILRAALERLAPGGQLVYSSCSLEKEENEDVVEEALSPGFRLLDCAVELEKLRREGELVWRDMAALTSAAFLRILPGVPPCDGFFAAVIRRG